MVSKTLSEIRPGKELWNIKARVTRLWNATLLSSGEQLSLDMILIDQEGTMMHGVINKAYMDKFKPLIEEGNVYTIANVRITPAAQKYRPVVNDRIVNFLPTTTLKTVKDTEDIPKYSFNFMSTDMLSARINVDMYLSDVIGVAAHIGPIEETRTNFGFTKIRDIVLLMDDHEVKVRFWGDKVEEVDDETKSHVIAITSTTVRKFGRYSLSSTNATKVYVDLPIPETKDAHDSSIDNIVKEIHIEDHLKGTLQDQMQYNRRTLEELNLILFEASNHDKENNVCRFKIKLQISDPTTSASCVLFDKEAEMIINESADSMISSADHDSKEVPESIQKICGQTLIFQFRLTEYNLTSFRPDYTVSKIFFLKEKSSSRIGMESVKKEVEDNSDKCYTITTENEEVDTDDSFTKKDEYISNSDVIGDENLSSSKRSKKHLKKGVRLKRKSKKVVMQTNTSTTTVFQQTEMSFLYLGKYFLST
uniref:DUF223 domain-containing protein n=1 Tax=Setaria italica TaxID=4555 RepID=K3YD99_SETIT